MTGAMRRYGLAAAVLGLAMSAGTSALGGSVLDPSDFTALGTLNITSGSYTFNTTTDTLTNSGGTVLFTGVTSNGIAVFDFSQIAISGGSFMATGRDPLALLSQGNISFTGGSFYLGGWGPEDAGPGPGGAGGPGGFAGSLGPGAGASGDQGGGGGYGGAGGAGGYSAGGVTYGNLAMQFVGGSGGGSGYVPGIEGGYFGGGGGGGAIEVGATGSLTINGGSIHANGGTSFSYGGGGSGGGIVLDANAVSVAGADALDVSGGYGGYGGEGGSGGGGRILILANTYTTSGTDIFNLAGGEAGEFGGGAGGAGVLTVGTLGVMTPEPSSLVLLAVALPVVGAAFAWRRRRTCASRRGARRINGRYNEE